MSLYQSYSTFQPSPHSYGVVALGRLSREERAKMAASGAGTAVSAGATIATVSGGGGAAAGGGARRRQ